MPRTRHHPWDKKLIDLRKFTLVKKSACCVQTAGVIVTHSAAEIFNFDELEILG